MTRPQQVDEDGLDVLFTNDPDKPIVELHWTGMTCDGCGCRAWKLWHAPEGGLLVQCDECHTTRGLRVSGVGDA